MKMSKKYAAMMAAFLISGCVSGITADAQDCLKSVSKNDHKTAQGTTITFGTKSLTDFKHSSIYTANGGQVDVTGTTVTFTGINESKYTSTAAGYFAGVMNGGGTININATELYLGSKDKGGDRGFQMKNGNNHLNITADKIVAYVGDGFINAQGNGKGDSVANIGTADHRVSYFEAHTTYGKDDYGVAILQANEGNTVNLYADTVILDGSTNKDGGVIGSGSYGTVNVDAKDLTIDGNICGSYGTVKSTGKTVALNIKTDTLNMKGDVNVGSIADKYSNASRDVAVKIQVAESAVIDGDINIVGNKGTQAATSDKSELTLEFNGDSKITGDITVEGSDTTQNATVNLGGTGDMTESKGAFKVNKSGNVNFTGGTWAVKEWTGDGSGDATVAEKAAVDISAKEMKTETLAIDGTANLVGGSAKVETNTLSGSGTVVTDDVNNSINAKKTAEKTAVSLHGTSKVADQIAADSSNAAKFLNSFTVGEGDTVKAAVDEATTDEGTIAGATTIKKSADGTIKVDTAVNATNQSISQLGAISLMTWRQENNDMNKRLGEVRASEGTQGVWARMTRGEAKYNGQGIKNQYNYYQLGYDHKISDSWILGGAFTYTDGKSSLVDGSGTNKHTGFAVYGSNLREDGSFIDIIAKYAHMKSDFDTLGGIGVGEYSTNGYALSAEYGKRFKQDGFWIEPQVELTYGHVGSADFGTSNGAKVHQDSMDSLVGRLGFSLGKDIKRGNVYVRASYLYDFDGDAGITMSKTGAGITSFSQDLGGSWWEYGFGTNLRLGHDAHFYFDFEKAQGGHVDTSWQWNAGVRFSF